MEMCLTMVSMSLNVEWLKVPAIIARLSAISWTLRGKYVKQSKRPMEIDGGGETPQKPHSLACAYP